MREDDLLRAHAAHQRRTTAVWPGRGPAVAAASLFVVGAVLGASLAPGSTFRPVSLPDLGRLAASVGSGVERAASVTVAAPEHHAAGVTAALTAVPVVAAPAAPVTPQTVFEATAPPTIEEATAAPEAEPVIAPAPTAQAPAVAGPPVQAAPAALPAPAPVAPVAPVAVVQAPATWQAPNLAVRPFPRRIERWRPLVRELLAEAWTEGRLTGAAAKLDDDLLLALIQQESSGDPEAISWAGAVGLMQVMPFTFADMHLGDKSLGDQLELDAMLDVKSNMRAGIRYLALAMQSHEGNVYWALASYNAGIEAVADWRAVGLYAVPPIGGYEETANYAQVILSEYLERRPDVKMHVPDPMPYEHVAGAVKLLIEAGRW